MEVRDEDLTSAMRRSRCSQQYSRCMYTTDGKDEGKPSGAPLFNGDARLLQLADWLAGQGITQRLARPERESPKEEDSYEES